MIATGFDKGRKAGGRSGALDRVRREPESAPRRASSDDIDIPEFLRED